MAELSLQPDARETGGTGFGHVLPRKTKLCYALGAVSETLMSNIIAALALPIYQIGLGISPSLLGLALGIPRFWDAVTDPIIAGISDNAHTRFGRRKPFILCGTLLAAGLCIALWAPPLGWGELELFFYFLTVSILYYTAFTLFVIPYAALGVEMTADPDERVRLMTYRNFMLGLGGILFLSWIYKLCIFIGTWLIGGGSSARPEVIGTTAVSWLYGRSLFLSDKLRVWLNHWLPEGIESAQPEVIGVRVVAVICAVIMILFVMFPLFFTREKYAFANKQRVPLFHSIICTFQNKPFTLLCLSNIGMTLGVYLIAPLGMYINLAYILDMDKNAFAWMAGIYSTMFGIMMMAPAPLVSYMGTRFGRKKVVITGLLMLLANYLLSWVTLTPHYPYLQLVNAMLTASGLLCFGVIAYVFIADICDYDELKTGFRREGMYHAIYAWCTKACYAGGTAIAGFIVAWTGFDTQASVQSEQTIFRLRTAFMVVPIVFLSLSIFCMSRYPLDKDTMKQVQRQLRQTRKTH